MNISSKQNNFILTRGFGVFGIKETIIENPWHGCVLQRLFHFANWSSILHYD